VDKEIRENYRMNYTKDTMIKNSQEMMRGNLNHTFFAVTIRPHISFMKMFNRFPTNTRHLVGVSIIENIIAKYNSHLISQPNKPRNAHLLIIHHDAVEEKHKNGSYDIPHSHGIWGIHNSLLDRWNDEGFHARLKELGSFQYKHKSYPLSNVIHSVWKTPFNSSLLDKTYPEGWLSYAYKWCADEDYESDWSFVESGNLN
jgi:hypothetical protein|tara:strand:- start:400 stop:999 length:600 start_codon:yes stop_codon:yes gene_type:complete